MLFNGWPDVDHAALEAERHRRFTELLTTLDLDHALLTNFDGVRYATGVRATVVLGGTNIWYCALVAEGGETTLMAIDVDGEDADPFPAQPWVTRRIAGASWQAPSVQPEYIGSILVRELRDAGARRVGIEELPFEIVDLLRERLPCVEFVPIKRDLVRLRAIKMPAEIRLLEAANAAGSHCMQQALQATRAGMTDHEVVGVAVGEGYRLGAEFVTHQVLVAEGLAKKDTWFPSGKRLRNGDTFMFDFGLHGQGGYAHDFCRTHFVGGDPTAEVAAAHRALVESYEEGIAVGRAGVRSSLIHTTINAALEQRGYPPTPYAMGHGIGLASTEFPTLTWPGGAEHDDLLEEGMALCIEPSTYIDAGGTTLAIKEEDVFIVEAGGLRPITTTPRAAV